MRTEIPNMSNKWNSKVDTFSLIKRIIDDNIVATSNLKYEHEVKLSSISGPTSINYSLLVEEMEVPKGRMVRESKSDNLSKDGDHIVKEIGVVVAVVVLKIGNVSWKVKVHLLLTWTGLTRCHGQWMELSWMSWSNGTITSHYLITMEMIEEILV